MRAWKGTWHPLAERFPMLDEDDLREMAASIAERGQYVPCRMTPDGLGLDGRNRVAACALAGAEPGWEVYEGDPIPFIVEVNAERRHLTTGQRAMAVAIGLVEAGQRSNGKFAWGSKPDAPSGTGRSRWEAAVAEAGVVLDHAHELADLVLRGEKALDAAYKEADDVRNREERIAAVGGELAALVETGVIDVAEAERRAEEARRLDALADDLATRVREGNLSFEEADALAAERRRRVLAWIDKVRDALIVLSRMKGSPIPDELDGELSNEERSLLAVVLDAIPEGSGQ